MDVLTFELQDNRFAIPAAAVAEVVRAAAVIPVAGAPRAVEGVFNLRGRVIPVVDTRARFGLAHVPLDPSQHFIIVALAARLVALRVDRVHTLAQIEDEQIEDARSTIPSAQYVAGVAKLDDGVVIIYDIEAFLTRAEADEMHVTLETLQAGQPTS